MSLIATSIGLTAAALTTVANVPQVIKAWRTGETEDLSLVTISTLAAGLALWIVYGVFQADLVIIGANTIALVVNITLVGLKLRHG